MIQIWDGLNCVRRFSQDDKTGRYPRNLLNQMQASKALLDLWVWDGPGAKKVRQAYYPPYKAKRVDPGSDFWALIDLVKKTLSYSKAFQITVPDVEADDVIAKLSRRYSGSHQVRIVSNDFDFAQIAGPSVHIEARDKEGVAHRHVRLFKTLVGDPSDGIPGLRGFGRKSWDRLGLAERDNLSKWFEDEDDSGIKKWLGIDDTKNSELKIFWKIIGFLDVPLATIDEHTSVGLNDYSLGDQFLKKYMQ